jgi:alpha-L-fucosidase 2
LRAVLAKLLSLTPELTTEKQRMAWANTLKDLPAIPVGRTSAQGKTPPLGSGDPKGAQVILPAETYNKPENSENPELYVAFPYRLVGVGKPNLELARNTFAARRFPANTCWGQDGNQAAILGLTSEAQKDAVSYFTNYGDQRFSWFWNKSHDWIPDMDNGGDGMITLQLMLMQTDGRRIQLLPAWPANWIADFKLHAPLETTVEGHVEGGKMTRLVVTPTSRANDVIVLKPE